VQLLTSAVRRAAGALLQDRSNHLLVQLFRYTLVGGLAFLVDFGSLAALKELVGLPSLVAASLAFLLGLTTNYLLCLAWVFKQRKLSSPVAEFLIFAGVGVVGLGINAGVIWALEGPIGLYYSKLVSTVVVYLWNFFARRLTLFR
jgi:putative flippase GtrA